MNCTNIAHRHIYFTCCAPGMQDEGFVMERLIVGVLLFVPLLALLPTTFVWYLTVSYLTTITLAARALLRLAASLLRTNLLIIITWRLLQPSDFPSRGEQ